MVRNAEYKQNFSLFTRKLGAALISERNEESLRFQTEICFYLLIRTTCAAAAVLPDVFTTDL